MVRGYKKYLSKFLHKEGMQKWIRIQNYSVIAGHLDGGETFKQVAAPVKKTDFVDKRRDIFSDIPLL